MRDIASLYINISILADIPSEKENMKDKQKIALLGGDSRHAMLASALCRMGYEVAAWGTYPDTGEAVRCKEKESAINGAAAVILPLPLSQDGETLSCPALCEKRVPLYSLFSLGDKDTLWLCGRGSAATAAIAKDAGIELYDYFLSEELQIKNAMLTAEGAVELALRELPVTLYSSNITVFGYGRTGKALARTLNALGVHVLVAARSTASIATAEINGCSALSLSKPDFAKRLFATEPDIIFNTVPAKVITREIMEGLPSDCRIIDLASLPGGVDTEAAEELGISVIRALSLPGKTAPLSAARLIADAVVSILEEKGICGDRGDKG